MVVVVVDDDDDDRALINLSIYLSISSNRGRKSLEARSLSDDERIATLEKQLAEAQIIAEDADRRYDEVCLLDRVPECF